jgi:starch synthase
MAALGEVWEVAHLRLPGHHGSVYLLEGRGENDMPVYLVHAPGVFDREGNPYVGPDSHDWPDNHRRFAILSRAAAAVALNHAGLNWGVDIVHGNDWQTGLIPALLNNEWERPATIFTIHNLSYFGLFSHSAFDELLLPADLWRMDGLEFYGNASFLKAGLAYADRINTVSPTYADEVRTSQYGYGLEGLLEFRSDRLSGILNGIDYNTWNPATDPHLEHNYTAETLEDRVDNKLALQRAFGLRQDKDALLFGYIGRLVEQKGADLILDILPRLNNSENVQLVILGTGNPLLENAIKEAQWRYPELLSCHIGYDEGLAHRIEGGVDVFLMPSRFEPCGLNQLYSLRYGAVPIVHKTGGLADSVINATPETLESGTGNGFVFDYAEYQGLWYEISRAIETYRYKPEIWRQLMLNGMARDSSWKKSAEQYIELYRLAMDEP